MAIRSKLTAAMTAFGLVTAALLFSADDAGAGPADCDRATRAYDAANGAPVRDRDTVDRNYREAVAACGGPIAQQPRAANVDTPAPPSADPGELVNCDTKGCWGSANGVRYTYAGGANLSGADGSTCVRGLGNKFKCN